MTRRANIGTLPADARVLVIIVARIGDTLLVTPTLRALKAHFPTGHLGVLAHPGRREMLQGLPFIDELRGMTPKSAWWRGRVGAQRWDLALVYGHDAPLIRYATRVAERVVAFDQHDETLNGLLWKAVPAPKSMHAVPERLLLAGALGIETQDHRLAYAPSEQEIGAARHWLAANADAAHPLVAFQVASFATKSYRDWPLAHFTELGRRILARHPQARILVLGDAQSRGHAQTLARELGSRVIPAAGLFGMRPTAALMGQLDLYVGVDTGPTHVAGALQVPMVALYHCRHRSRHLAPLQHPRLRALDHPAADTECGATSPMSDITVDQVWEAVASLLVN